MNSEQKLKELNKEIEKDIQEGKQDIFLILKTVLYLGLGSIILVLIISIFRG